MEGSNPAALPVAPEDLFQDGRWMSVHERFVSESLEREPDFVFLGDSLLAHFSYTQMWTDLFAPLHCLNFGISGDQTQHVLWRIQHGELDNVNPKAVVLLVGTNNAFHSAEQVAEGILTVIHMINEKLPDSLVLVMSLLPRGHKPNRLREKNAETNQIVSKGLRKIPKARFLDVTQGFVQPDGTISHLDMHDYLHFSVGGYKKAFTIVHDNLIALLADEKEEEGLLSLAS